MRFTYAEAMTQAAYYAPLAQAAEATGYTSMTVADSLIYPKESDSTYPYTDTGDREFLEDKEFVETMVLTAHLAAVTSTLRFTPFVLKLPVRPPVLVAKQASSIAFLSGNRGGLGGGLCPSASASGCPRGRRTSRRSACRGSGAASGWTSASTSCAG
jgi:alkanesulfonate monooxygenase SsuD/methylene tetrahydromethanopterin reductase-like flavin-dependent oxidoreductase (luciferase family)